MTERARDNDSSGKQPQRDDLLLDAVADYVRLTEAEPSERVDLDKFVHRYPEELRQDLRDMCRAHHGVAREFSSLEPDPSSKTNPQRRIGEFAILDELGRGGMGIVYLAEQIGLGRKVALKVLAPNFAFSASHKERFRREAAAAARLNHPGIAPIHAYGEIDGTLFYAMEFVPGRDLADHIAAAQAEGQKPKAAKPNAAQPHLPLGVLPQAPYPVEVAELIARIADALHEAHELGIVHRDVKPSNVLLGADGNPRVLDFGLAKSEQDEGFEVSRSGDLTGTPLYMSPEQTLARRAPVDRRSDVFSLGVILYELASGARAFDGDTLQDLVFQICFVEPKSLERAQPPIPRDLATICAKAMEKDPRARYQTAAEFADDLRRFTSFRPVRAKPASVWVRSQKWLRRHRTLAGTAGTTLLLGLAVAGYYRHINGLEEARFQTLVERVDACLNEGRVEPAEVLLREAAALRPHDAAIDRHYQQIADARQRTRRSREVSQLAAERLLTQSALERSRDPELALALAVLGVQRRQQGLGLGQSERREIDAARAGADCASIVAALAECIRSTPLTIDDASAATRAKLVPGSPRAVVTSDGKVALWNLSNPGTRDFVTVPLERKASGAFAISADGRLLAIVESGAVVSLWRLPDLEPAGTVALDAPTVRGIRLSADGKALAAIVGRGGCQLWRLDGQVPERTFARRSRSGAIAMEFAPGRSWLLVQHSDRSVWVLRDDGTMAMSLDAVAGQPLPASAAALWLPSGDAIVRSSGSNSISVYALADAGRPGRTFRCASRIAAMAVSADGAVLASGCDDHTARLWSLDDGRELLLVSGHEGAVQHLAVSGARGIVVTAGADRVVTVHEVATGRQLASMPQPDYIESLDIADSAGSADSANNAQRVLCGFRSRAPLVWDLDARRPALTIAAHRAPVRTVAVSDDAAILATTGEDGWLRTWNGSNGTLRRQRRYRGMAVAARWTFFDQQGSLRVVASEHLHEVRSDDLEELAHAWLRRAPGDRNVRRMRGVRHAATGPDGELWFVLAGSACTLAPPTRDSDQPPEVIERIPGGDSPIVATQPLADGAVVVLRGHGELQMWQTRAASTSKAATIAAQTPRLRLLDTNATGDRWAVAGTHGLEVFDQSGRSVIATAIDGDEITALAMSNDGDLIALGHRNGRVTLFDVGNHSIRLHWRPHQDRIDSIALTRDGSICATASMDQTVRVWPTDAVAAARAYGVRPLNMAERERFGLLDEIDRQVKSRVDRLYTEHVLTRDVLSALDAGRTSESSPPATALWLPGALERARAYALERPNPSPEVLHQRAARISLDPESGPPDLEHGLALARAASRLRPKNPNYRVMLALSRFRLDRATEALDALDVAFGLEIPKPTQPLAWAVRALSYDALGRSHDAKQARRRLSQALRARRGPGTRGQPGTSGQPGNGPQGRPGPRGPRSAPGPQAPDRSRFPWQAANDRYWIDRAETGR